MSFSFLCNSKILSKANTLAKDNKPLEFLAQLLALFQDEALNRVLQETINQNVHSIKDIKILLKKLSEEQGQACLSKLQSKINDVVNSIEDFDSFIDEFKAGVSLYAEKDCFTNKNALPSKIL